MCTLTFNPRDRGFALAMNRDEKRARARGAPPAPRTFGNTNALLPSESGGGTWIGVNEHAVCLALINWYSVPSQPRQALSSRGGVIPSLLDAPDAQSVRERLKPAPLSSKNPFRLIGVFAREKAVVEWQWNGRRLEVVEHPWALGIWISSGFDEPGAQQARGATFLRRRIEQDPSQGDWLRQLHASHIPEAGAYSVCMHRADAATVSCSEITVNDETVRFAYCDGPPCSGAAWTESQLALLSASNPR
ncbi:MAG: NRDE family protein [Verrucomicrobia bacterium]|nr:NRDE family protein [Verrucomicrobiota bacterium]MBI3868193.1 NRDE family protein [Verrucomicrobiota bacterium]